MRLAPLLLVATLAIPASAGGGAEHLHWRRTYGEALLEARIRNIPVFVTRHKDECGRCERQRRAVLEQSSFIRFANAHVIPLVAHNERLHDEVEAVVDGEKVWRCPLYPGLRCRDHVRAAVDIDNAREEDLIQVPFEELCPNTWLVLPTGEVERVQEQDQFVPDTIHKQVADVQGRLGKPLPPDAFAPVKERLTRAATAIDEEHWHDALEALASIRKVAPEPHAALKALVDAKMADIDEWVAFEAEDVLEGGAATTEQRTLVQRLLAAVDVEVYGRRVPVHARLAAWLEKKKGS